MASMEKDSDSTATSLDENTDNFCDNPTRDILAEGLISVFKPTVDRLDEKIQSTRGAQIELSQFLDSLLKQLREIDSTQESMPELDEKVKTLIDMKHKVTVVANVLQNCQERLAQLHRSIEIEHQRRRNLNLLNSTN